MTWSQLRFESQKTAKVENLTELSVRLFMPVLKHNSLLEEGCYRPIKIIIPASSARIPMTLFGITKRTINGSPCKISQSASNIIPTDMLSLPFF